VIALMLAALLVAAGIYDSGGQRIVAENIVSLTHYPPGLLKDMAVLSFSECRKKTC
jgi:hypothetical protein